MAKKEFFVVIDTETTQTEKVYDFGAVVVDRKGKIYASCAVIIADVKDDELFYDANNVGLWSKNAAKARKVKYQAMVDNGTRLIASVNAVNRWLEKVNAKYAPTVTAYNIAFDREKCANTGIDLSIFNNSFCLWHLCCSLFANTKSYKEFVIANHYIGNRTKFGNLTYKTNAEVMAHFILGSYSEEPHTALEDAQFYEVPCLVACIKKKGWKTQIGNPYNWKDYQIKDHFIAKPVSLVKDAA